MHFLIISFILFAIGFAPLHSLETSNAKIHTLYNSLDPSSIAQHLAFYELYPQFPEGQEALLHAYRLFTGGEAAYTENLNIPASLASSVHGIIGLVNKNPNENVLELNDKELEAINRLAQKLKNRRLQGYYATSEEAILQLPPNQIDLAHGILLTQLGNTPEAIRKIRSYEATIDLMALQILTRITMHDSPAKKIRAINHFIFEEMGFRFPPHSSYAKDVDLYTFLPSVLDSRRGVCLGVSILYICLAQRLDLNLQMVTPPGHIFVRWSDGNEIINIETTARGVHLPDEKYLGVDTRSLEQRTIKEVIGLAHFNQASVFWERKQHEKALESYSKAKPYLPEDKLLIELMGFNTILKGDKEAGKQLLQLIVNHIPEHAVCKSTLSEDFLNGVVDVDGVEAVFMHVDENRDSILAKRQALENAVSKYPKFREGYFSLAGTWLELHRIGEALQALRRYHEIDPHNVTVEYYLSAIYSERLDFNNAWKHFRIAENIVKQRNHHPAAILELRQELARQCPEYISNTH